jgi:hypothetical protein
MKLFEMKNWQLVVSEEVWALQPFSKILKRDKSKDKVVATAEIAYVWYFSDIKSDYLLLTEEERISELKKDIAGLPKNWEPDSVVKEAIDLYKSKSITVIQKLYQQSLKSASDIGNYLENTDVLLAERTERGIPVTDISKITNAVQKVPKLMADLKSAYKEVVKEQEDTANKKKGSQSFNLFENGIELEK